MEPTDYERVMKSSAPKWVKDIVERIERERIMAKRQVEELAAAQPPSRVFQDIRAGVDDRVLKHLDDERDVHFYLGDGTPAPHGHDSVGVRIEDNGHIIQVQGGDSLEVMPWSSNIVRIRLWERERWIK